MSAVSNATPCIALALIDRLAFLPRLFTEVVVPPMVYEEVTAHGDERPGATALAHAAWLRVQSPQAVPTIEPLLLGLDPGEFQVLLLARELQPDWVLIDERLGRRVARAIGLPVKGTVGILLAAFHAGLISREQALEAAHQLVQKGIRISPEILAWFETELV